MFANVEKAFGFRPPPRHGHDAVNAMQAMVAGQAKVLVCLGGNFSIALPDSDYSSQGMRNLDLAVHIATKPNRSHLLIAKQSTLLPVLGRTERDLQATGAQSVTVEDSMSMVHASRRQLGRRRNMCVQSPRSSPGSRWRCRVGARSTGTA